MQRIPSGPVDYLFSENQKAENGLFLCNTRDNKMRETTEQYIFSPEQGAAIISDALSAMIEGELERAEFYELLEEARLSSDYSVSQGGVSAVIDSSTVSLIEIQGSATIGVVPEVAVDDETRLRLSFDRNCNPLFKVTPIAIVEPHLQVV